MYIGKVVEYGHSEELYSNPLHPYTKALIASALPIHPSQTNIDFDLPGEVASPLNPPPGCRFHPRCTIRKPICSKEEPRLMKINQGHNVACHIED